MNETKIKKDYSVILEEVIDTLTEVGNGVTEQALHEAADKLLDFRDNHYEGLKKLKKIQELGSKCVKALQVLPSYDVMPCHICRKETEHSIIKSSEGTTKTCLECGRVDIS